MYSTQCMTDNFLLNSRQVGKEMVKSDTILYTSMQNKEIQYGHRQTADTKITGVHEHRSDD